jgi:hypothetical protein
MKRWFFPSWSGDFRLEEDGDKSILTVIKPTPAEIDKLDIFLEKAREKKWVRQHIGFIPDGEIKIEVAASVQDAGKMFIGEKPKGKLTAIRSEDGKVTAIWDEKGLDKAEEAATVRRPTLCCPTPVPGPDQRASEVLQAFCTPRQWKDWCEDGFLRCYGNLSGRLYEVLHRHHPIAIERGKITYDVEAGCVMHCYDWSVPPAEEVLSIKLVLEHAEHWIRNLSGCLRWNGDTYRDPFVSDQGQLFDGVADASFVRGIGRVLKMALTGKSA